MGRAGAVELKWRARTTGLSHEDAAGVRIPEAGLSEAAGWATQRPDEQAGARAESVDVLRAPESKGGAFPTERRNRPPESVGRVR